MWKNPDKILLSYSIFSGGTLEFGYARSGGGMSVGTNPLMSRINIPIESGGTDCPNEWFELSYKYSIIKLRSEFDAELFKNRGVFIPAWLKADMFEYHYKKLKDAEPKTSFVSGGLLQEQQDSTLRTERDEARAQRDNLLARLREVLPWVGLTPFSAVHIREMSLIKDLAKDSLLEITTDVNLRENRNLKF